MDSDMIPEVPEGIERVIKIPATAISRQDLKAPVTANMIMLGALWRAAAVVSRPALERAIAEAVPQSKIDLNLRAFEKGVRAAENQPASFGS